MKIFITGAAGFLGSHLADRMLELGHEVIGCDNYIGGYQDNVNHKMEFHHADCMDLAKMRELTKGCEIVYHCASTAYEGLSVFSPHFVTMNTYQITMSVLSASIENRVRRFVYCSSMARYGFLPVVPFTEEMTPMPLDPYGIAKLASENTIVNLAKVHNFEYAIAVPHNIIGARQKYDDPFRNVAAIMINLMLQGRQPIIYGDGEQKRNFSFVQDCIYCLEKMAFQDNVVGEVINIGPDDEFVTINELAQVIGKLLNMEVKPDYYPDRPMEVKHASCSADKARRLLNYKPNMTLEAGLTEMINYIKKRGVLPFEYHLDVEIKNDKTPKTWTNRLF
ncbi:MAG TPA: NAD-dependent epimerase/dehydratase family protein [Bacteroidia bacterium]|nr:NAD-dependent epimerase/dehydratase family protein [Bacteroidota bacterium]MBL0050307.1 NAD-dependent epimerase/dehydratase family protein [Bacteroidota bacterium]HRC32781.1 NAD-dependent epimerase/dehydratase family protein [Bacteroidia bacterium]